MKSIEYTAYPGECGIARCALLVCGLLITKKDIARFKITMYLVVTAIR